jgi:hypothetical protein
MSPRELLELAALDVHGLLDEFEAAIYTRSYHDAPAMVQDEIKRLQAELAADERLLPSEEPDPGLRERVLKAVAQAIERDESRLAPLATIGRRRGGEQPQGRFHVRASAQFWRAACFVLAGVAVVFSLFWVQAQNYADQVTEIVFLEKTQEVINELIGPTFRDYLFDDDTTIIRLVSEDDDSKAKAVIMIDENTREAFLATDGLPQGGPEAYTLAVTDVNGNQELQRFRSTGGVQGFPVGSVEGIVLATAQWKILNAAGAVILSSA